jgi:hypothetical protein
MVEGLPSKQEQGLEFNPSATKTNKQTSKYGIHWVLVIQNRQEPLPSLPCAHLWHTGTQAKASAPMS